MTSDDAVAFAEGEYVFSITLRFRYLEFEYILL